LVPSCCCYLVDNIGSILAVVLLVTFTNVAVVIAVHEFEVPLFGLDRLHAGLVEQDDDFLLAALLLLGRFFVIRGRSYFERGADGRSSFCHFLPFPGGFFFIV